MGEITHTKQSAFGFEIHSEPRMVAEKESESETHPIPRARPKPRPIVQLGIFLISHSLLFSVVFSTAGVLALLLLPVLAKNTYISENALMPGSVAPMLSNQEVAEANRLVKDLTSLNSKPLASAIGSQRLISQYMSNLGAEVSHHKFHPQLNQFHPLHFFSSPDSGRVEQNISCALHGVNTVGIIRAPRGDGKEAIVLVTPFNSVKLNLNEALSLAIAYSVFSLLTRVPWLAKDVIWLVADSQFGEYSGVAAWLRDYHTPVFSGLGTLDAEMCPESNNIYGLNENLSTKRTIYDGFKRAGTMAAALVIKVADRSEQYEDSLSIYAEASNGQMPNLDLINIARFAVKVEKFWPLLGLKWLKTLGEIFESLGHLARSVNPQWKFGIPAADYIEGSATLASSLYYQALGVPTGPHGAFRDYQVDAITLEIFPKVSSLDNKVRQNDFLLRSGRLIEGVIRSVNNLLEKFHQSFFLYLLTSPGKFVSVGVYMIAFALLVAPLPMVAASLYVDASNSDYSLKIDKPAPFANASDEPCITLKSWKWLFAAKKVFFVHLWGSVVSLLPYFICQIPSCTPTTSFIIWVFLSILSLVVMYIVLASPSSHANESQPQRGEWAILKSVTLSAAFIGLCLMSVINFASAEIGGLLMVPMCLMAHPLKLDVKARSIRTVSRVVYNLVLGFIGFPPVAFIVLKGAFEGFSGVNVGDFWSWVESLWAWNSATYLYIGMNIEKKEVG
ncbi:GPI transamidase component family protein / Gaa1-like family protein [Prunus dulcis]|uniref:GPI transamidase component family protein / Gaa1-like family protein n=1 Tax=Prunus dulcis TaxID=3755 RepID=A0A4Y1R8E4_PRUDU|nr:GPI transamidase component family protein / Gaa1-like family protein [Prunus dulcis]